MLAKENRETSEKPVRSRRCEEGVGFSLLDFLNPAKVSLYMKYMGRENAM